MPKAGAEGLVVTSQGQMPPFLQGHGLPKDETEPHLGPLQTWLLPFLEAR